MSRISSKRRSLKRSRTKSRKSLKSSKESNKLISKPYCQVYRLFLENYKYRFSSKFPKDIEQEKDPRTKLLGKLWFIKKTIRRSTYFDDRISPITSSYVHPEGFCCFPPLATSSYFDNVYDDLQDLFKFVLENKPEEVPISDARHTNGTLFLFTGEKEKTKTYSDPMSYLKKHSYKSLHNCIQKYIKFLCKLYDVPYSVSFLNDHVRIRLLRYNKEQGLDLHIDNIALYDQGPIITISIGPPYVYYDMTPAILPNKKATPLRFASTEGSIFIMDGSSRMEWAHGLPHNVPQEHNKQKFTILLKCDRFRHLNPVYNKVLQHKITSSKRVC